MDRYSASTDQALVVLGSVRQQAVKSAVYTYDFGDGWEHEIKLKAPLAKYLDFESAGVRGWQERLSARGLRWTARL